MPFITSSEVTPDNCNNCFALESTLVKPTSKCSVLTNSSFNFAADSAAASNAFCKAGDTLGCRPPDTAGKRVSSLATSFEICVASTLILANSGRVMPSVSFNIAANKCSGSISGFPVAVAWLCASATMPWALVVSLSNRNALSVCQIGMPFLMLP